MPVTHSPPRSALADPSVHLLHARVSTEVRLLCHIYVDTCAVRACMCIYGRSYTYPKHLSEQGDTALGQWPVSVARHTPPETLSLAFLPPSPPTLFLSVCHYLSVSLSSSLLLPLSLALAPFHSLSWFSLPPSSPSELPVSGSPHPRSYAKDSRGNKK